MLGLPLELKYPETPFDENQEILLKSEALDLVLIENASQLFLNWVLDKKHLENILLCISRNNKNIHPFPSHTFTMENYKNEIKLYFEKRKPFIRFTDTNITKVIAIYAIDLKTDGGHYNAFIYDKNTKELIIFDPMGDSAYWRIFSDIGKKIINTTKIKRADFCPQPTGGFHGNIPLEAKEYKLSEEEKKLFAIQHVNSQDHFCMMWSIWFIHIVLYEKNYIKLLNEVTENGLKALVTIKIYINELMKLCFNQGVNVVKINLLNNNFWNAHFHSIWHSKDTYNNFKRYDIVVKDNTLIYNAKYELKESDSYYKEYKKYEKLARKYNINEIIPIVKLKWGGEDSDYININPLKLLKSLMTNNKKVLSEENRVIQIHSRMMSSYNKIMDEYKKNKNINFSNMNLEELSNFYKYYTGKTLNNVNNLKNAIKDDLKSLRKTEYCTINDKENNNTIIEYRPCFKNIDKILKQIKGKTEQFAEYQKRVLNHMVKNSGLLVMHGTGTGKSLSAILTVGCLAKMFPLSIIHFITPSSVLENISREINIYLEDSLVSNRILIQSHQKFVKNVDKMNCNNSIVVVDEAHIFRTEIKESKENDGTKRIKQGNMAYQLLKCTKKACKVILLTATPLVNQPYDIENLLAMISHRDPISKKEFNKLTDDQLIKMLKCNVSIYFKPENDPDYPKKAEHIVKIPATEKTYKTYKQLKDKEGKRTELPELIKWDDPEVVAMRGYSNLINVIDQDKINFINVIMEKYKGKTIIFTQLVANHINQITDILIKKNPSIKFGIISGDVNAKERFKIANEYNKDNLDVIIITKAGAEGIDLKYTSNIIILDPL